MNPKTFLAFALGCFVAGGAAYFFSKPPAANVAAVAAEPVKKAAEPEVPITPDRVISPASESAPPSSVAAAPAVKRAGFRPAVDREMPAKPSPVAAAKPASTSVAAAPSASPATAMPPSQPQQAAAAPAPEPAPQPKFEALPPPPASTPERAPEAHRAATHQSAQPPAQPKANSVTIIAGTTLSIRLQEGLSSERNKAGDTFLATLEQPVIVDGFVIAERGSRVEGRITELERAGRVKGLARMVLEVTRINTSDGQRVQVQTSAYEKKAETTKKADAAKVGIGAMIGAAIGGIAGGGKGAATGAGVGGAAGAGDVLLTRGSPVVLPVEARLTFRLQEPVTLTEKLSQ